MDQFFTTTSTQQWKTTISPITSGAWSPTTMDDSSYSSSLPNFQPSGKTWKKKSWQVVLPHEFIMGMNLLITPTGKDYRATNPQRLYVCPNPKQLHPMYRQGGCCTWWLWQEWSSNQGSQDEWWSEMGKVQGELYHESGKIKCLAKWYDAFLTDRHDVVVRP